MGLGRSRGGSMLLLMNAPLQVADRDREKASHNEQNRSTSLRHNIPHSGILTYINPYCLHHD
jgi:hypothetical protein